MLEVAIISIKCALRDEFEEFAQFYRERSWESAPKADETSNEGEATVEEGAPNAVENSSEASLAAENDDSDNDIS
jgi:hypothetical protein